tara:strand:+ start:319 stop:633 length:315 start_codon:yes stop_codon:yes gene_type:complete
MNNQENYINYNSKGWHQESDLNDIFKVVGMRYSKFSLQSRNDSDHVAIELSHKDGRKWALTIGQNHSDGSNVLALYEYKSKKGWFNQATDAQSVSFDKMVCKLK